MANFMKCNPFSKGKLEPFQSDEEKCKRGDSTDPSSPKRDSHSCSALGWGSEGHTPPYQVQEKLKSPPSFFEDIHFPSFQEGSLGFP